MALIHLILAGLITSVTNVFDVEAYYKTDTRENIYSHDEVEDLKKYFEQRLRNVENHNAEMAKKIEILLQENKRLSNGLLNLESKNQNQIHTHKEELDQMSNLMQSHDTRISTLEKENKYLKEKLEDTDEVQSLKNTVELIQKENDALNTSTRSVMKRFTALEGQNKRLMRKLNKRSSRGLPRGTGAGVAFYARLSHDVSNVGDGQPIVMDYAVTNDGGTYSHRTGVFTCAVPGMYVFFVTQLTFAGKRLETLIVHNGNAIGYIYSGDKDYYSSGSNMAVIRLDIGDEVWVKVNDYHHGTGLILDEDWTTFSGFLLY